MKKLWRKLVTLLFISFWPLIAYAKPLLVTYHDCAVSVEIDADNIPLNQLLKDLAESLKFELIISDKLTQNVTYKGVYPRDKFVRDLVKNHNNFISSNKLAACNNDEFITKLIVLAPGEGRDDDGLYNYKPMVKSATNSEYEYIDDMQQYVLDVLSGEQPLDKSKISPEQQLEFQEIKKRLKKRKRAYEKVGKSLEDELAKEQGVNKNE